MNDFVLLGIYAGMLTVVLGIIVWHVSGISQEIKQATADIRNDHGGIPEQLKQEIYDLLTMSLEDTIGNMELPTWKDHLMGGLMPLLQSRFSQLDPRNLIKDGMGSIEDYGSKTQENQ